MEDSRRINDFVNLSIHAKTIEEIAQSLDDGKLQSKAVIERIRKVAQEEGDCVAIVLTAFEKLDKTEELTGKQSKFVHHIALVDQTVSTEFPLSSLDRQEKLEKVIAKMIGKEEMDIQRGVA
jgi:hypothetical protein